MSGPVVFALRAILAALLYLFLGWALFSLWQNIKQQSALLANRKVPPISLSIRSTDFAPQVRHFAQPEVTVGRHSTCEIVVAEDSASARHARLSYHHGQWWLEDLESTNGTFLNAQKLLLPTVVITGDEFRCGDTILVISLAAETVVSPLPEVVNK